MSGRSPGARPGHRALVTAALVGGALCAAGCGGDDGRCGPAAARVEAVVDGDTVVLEGGARVRYLLVDTNEVTAGRVDCWGDEARRLNHALVAGRTVELSYDAECRDRYDRLLAWVTVDGVDVNRLLVERGHACVLVIPPNGEDRADELRRIEDAARGARRGMWGACEKVACAR